MRVRGLSTFFLFMIMALYEMMSILPSVLPKYCWDVANSKGNVKVDSLLNYN